MPSCGGFTWDPSTQVKYTALKVLLLQCYSLSDAERAEKLLSLLGLGDGTALKLMESTLLGTDDGGFTHVFLRQLLAPVPAGLANTPLLASKDCRSLAEEADCILLATRRFSIQAIVPDSPTYHQHDSAMPPLQFQGPGKRSRQRSVAAATAGDKERLLSIEDLRSGRRFLVDSGSQKSLRNSRVMFAYLHNGILFNLKTNGDFPRYTRESPSTTSGTCTTV